MLTELSARTYLLARTSVVRSLLSYPVHLLLFLPGFQLRINTALECSSYSVRKSRYSPIRLVRVRYSTPTSDPTLLPQFDQPSFPSYLSLPTPPYSSPYPDPDPSPYSESANRGPLSRNPCVTNSFAKVLTCASPTSGRTPTPNPVLVRPPELNSGQHGPNRLIVCETMEYSYIKHQCFH